MDKDAVRDVLALLGAALRDDREGMETVIAHCDLPQLVFVLAATVIEVLGDPATDPAEWVAAQQARMRDELSE